MSETRSMPDEPESIWDLKRGLWTDEPRFFPPGQHPAYFRWRWTLAKLEEIGQGDSDEARYIRDEIAKFEQAESDAKARYDYWLSQRRRGPQ